MICRECAWEADAVQGRTPGEQLTHREIRAYNQWSKHGGVEKVGHEACKGCDCHHKPIPGRIGLLEDGDDN